MRRFMALLVLFCAATSEAEVRYVDQSVVGGSETGADWDNAFSDLQDALAVATSGDEIWVASGTYVPSLAEVVEDPRTVTFALVDGVAVYGGFSGGEVSLDQRNPDPETNGCVLSGTLGARGIQEAYHVVTAVFTGSGTLLDGFAIRNATADGPVQYNDGAGVYQLDGSLTLRNLHLTALVADDLGGGIFTSGNLVLENVTFDGTVAGDGGGLGIQSGGTTVSIIGSTFRGGDTTFGGGGAINLGAANLEIEDTVFEGNRGNNQGGAIQVKGNSASLRMERVRFQGNFTRSAGGAIYLRDASKMVAVNTLFVGNSASVDAGGSGGALAAIDTANIVLTNCTLASNYAEVNGGGVALMEASSLVVQNSVLHGNVDEMNLPSVQQIWIDPMSTATGTVHQSIIEGGFAGTNNLMDDPLFTSLPDAGDGDWETGGDNDYGNLRVVGGSPAIDSGDNTVDVDDTGLGFGTIADVAFDLDREDRLWDDPQTVDTGVGPAPVVDRGAYELQYIFADGFETGDFSRWYASVP